MTSNGYWRSSRSPIACMPRHEARHRGLHNPAVARREEAGRAAVPLDDGVGDECRAVHDGAQVGEADAGRSERLSRPSGAG